MKKLFLLALLSILIPVKGHAISFALDSIATWGKFPRFVVDTYRWGDKFFNGYDTLYVKPTGYKFNAKLTTDSWADGYRFLLPNNTRIYMRSDPSTSIGAHLTYLAVSAGYDVNISNVFGHEKRARQRMKFGFSCMLFSAEAYLIRNDASVTIRQFGDRHSKPNYHLPFDGIDNTTWGIDAYYYISHKRYSEAASFNYSRLQRRSHGSLYVGMSYYNQQLSFDFNGIPDELKWRLPKYWDDNHYKVDSHNYAIRLGYGYNWVFAPGWVLGVSESPTIGLRNGYVNSDMQKYSFSLYNHLKCSVTWNSPNMRWFASAVGKMELALINDRDTHYAGGLVSTEALIGYRFNLW